MNTRNLLFILFFSISFSGMLLAQKTTIFSEANLAYKRGIEFYEKGLFGLAQKEFKKVQEKQLLQNELESELLLKQAELYYAKCAVKMGMNDGEKLILDFARTYSPDPIANQAILEIANYYYDAGEYVNASELYAQINPYDLSKDKRSEVKFKEGYSYFVTKKFTAAKICFEQIKDIENKYYYPSNYYFGLTAFFEDKYDVAVSHFQKVANSKKYKPYIPYYISQIYFAQGEFDKLLAYAGPKVNDPEIKNRKNLYQLIGLAHFEKKNYKDALPYLEYFVEKSDQLRLEDYYQLGYAQYKNGQYAEASENLNKLAQLEGALGQTAMFTLGDCYLRLGNKKSAKSAFQYASKKSDDVLLQEEALFNYGKLSYELNDDAEAIFALQKVKPSFKHHEDAQTMLSSIFLNTRDYSNALRMIDEMPTKTPKLRETYQKVAFNHGAQMYKDNNPDQAKVMFEKSLETPLDSRTKALAHYWLGEIAHNNKLYDESIGHFNKFFKLGKSMSNLPDNANVYTANYTQGYNYLKQKNHKAALGFFKNASSGINKNKAFISDPFVKKNMLADANMRAGDCLFKARDYDKAMNYYNAAINENQPGIDYAIYQTALIEGLRGNSTEKMLALEDIVDDHPNSEYADNALYQLGATYQELGKLDLATKPLKQLVSNYKGRSELVNQALLRLGLISYNQGSLNVAISYYKKVFDNNPTAEEAQAAMISLEEIYIDDLGKPEEYFAFIETIPGYEIEEDQKDDINFKSAEVKYENGEFEKAISGYNQYISKYSNGRNIIIALYHRAECYAFVKDYSKAMIDYESVMARGQSRYYEKAAKKAAVIAYNHEKDFVKAFDFYAKWEKVAANDDDRFEAQLGGLRSAYRLAKMDAVVELSRKVSNNALASDEQRATANYYLGKIAFDQKDYGAAIAAFNTVIRKSKNEQAAEARYMIAYIYYLQRDLDVAKTLCENANKESAGYQYWIAKSVILLADIHSELGNLFDARAALESVVEFFKDDPELIEIAKKKLELLKAKENSTNNLVPSTAEDGNLEMEEEEIPVEN